MKTNNSWIGWISVMVREPLHSGEFFTTWKDQDGWAHATLLYNDFTKSWITKDLKEVKLPASAYWRPLPDPPDEDKDTAEEKTLTPKDIKAMTKEELVEYLKLLRDARKAVGYDD